MSRGLVTATQIASVVSAMQNLIMSNSATLGGITQALERDEHPGVALESGYIPCAYVLPIVEGKLNTEFDMGHDALRMEFPVTVLLYYRADDLSFIPTNRNYMLDLIDIVNDNYALGGWQSYKCESEIGYWESSGDIVHYSINKFLGRLWV